MSLTMKALQYLEIGARPKLVEIERPFPAAGEVLLKVTAAGACHSDEFVMGLPADQYPYGLPLTLGREGAGVVEAVGDGVDSGLIGTSVAVYGPWGCGYCRNCSVGKENYCTNAERLGIRPPGLGAPGAMAEYMVVDSARHLVPLGDLDPVKAVSLTDAGLTPYHAIKSALGALGPGSTAVVIGVGGLGHVAIQIVRALSSATVIALDLNEDKLTLAGEVGAHHTMLSNHDAIKAVRDLTLGEGANAVFDFVGAQPTVELAGAMTAVEGEIRVVGIGGGALPVGVQRTAWNVGVRAPYWGSRSELIEVLDLARSGAVAVEVESFSLNDAPMAYERLHSGTLRGRAVVVP
jgi:alcohol dehydrogenase, propanol-preferring